MAASHSSHTQLAFRTLKETGLLTCTPSYSAPASFPKQGSFKCCGYDPSGQYFAWASAEQVTIVDPATGKVVTTLPAPSVYELGFSPLGTYIITWQRPSKDEAGDAVKNLKVWKTIDESAGSEGERDTVGRFVQKSQTGWNLQYTSDERFCARAVTNQIQIYQSDDLGTVWNHLRVEGVTDFAVAPGETHSIAVFVPERKGNPAAIKVFKVPQFETPVSQKTFFKGDKVQMKWNQLGTSVIVLATTDVDKSNRSYYGETNMYILSAGGGFDARISLDKEGPIHDVTWSPTSKSFGVVYGYMPAKTVIFNQKAEAIHTFPLSPRNTIMFSPHGRFVLVAGFGNLAGQMDIYDLNKDYTKLCTIEASNASHCEWSPDGQHILTATLSPRLRVENGIRIWHVLGGLMYFEEMNELYEVTWRPQSPDKHPVPATINPAPVAHESALSYIGKAKTPSKPAGAYRPPGARGTTTPLHFKREDEGGAAYVNNSISSTARDSNNVNGFGARKRRDVPGATLADDAEGANDKALPPGAVPGGGVSLTPGEGEEGLSKAALKNKKKKEARKNREKEGGGVEGAKESERAPRETNGMAPSLRGGQSQHLETPSKGPGGERSRSRPRTAREKRAEKPTPALPPGLPVPAQAQQPALELVQRESLPTDSDLVPGSPQEKKVRSLVKKLRAIEELKMRQAGGEKLELSQVSKIRSEETVRKELDGLGGGG